jgi:hypothetical protein
MSCHRSKIELIINDARGVSQCRVRAVHRLDLLESRGKERRYQFTALDLANSKRPWELEQISLITKVGIAAGMATSPPDRLCDARFIGTNPVRSEFGPTENDVDVWMSKLA